MSKLLFTEDHEYIRTGDGEATVGISDYAQSQLGDIVFVELPEVGATFAKGDEFAVVESVKAASEIYAPAAMTITAINDALTGTPELVNSAAMADGWLVKVSLSDEGELEGLMDEAKYADHTA